MALSSASVVARDRAFTASFCFKVWVRLWRYVFTFVVHHVVQKDKINTGLLK